MAVCLELERILYRHYVVMLSNRPVWHREREKNAMQRFFDMENGNMTPDRVCRSKIQLFFCDIISGDGFAS